MARWKVEEMAVSSDDGATMYDTRIESIDIRFAVNEDRTVVTLRYRDPWYLGFATGSDEGER